VVRPAPEVPAVTPARHGMTPGNGIFVNASLGGDALVEVPAAAPAQPAVTAPVAVAPIAGAPTVGAPASGPPVILYENGRPSSGGAGGKFGKLFWGLRLRRDGSVEVIEEEMEASNVGIGECELSEVGDNAV